MSMKSHHSNSVHSQSHKSRASSRASSTADRQRHHDDEDATMDREILEELDEWKERRRRRKQQKENRQEERDSQAAREKRQREMQQRHDEMDKLRERLLQASRKRDSKALREAIRDAEVPEDPKNKTKAPPAELRPEYSDIRPVYNSAVELMQSIEKLENLEKARKKVDHTTIVEIRKLDNMAEAVHQVVIATLTLLAKDDFAPYRDDDRRHLAKALKSSWKACQGECVTSGDGALHKRIKNLKAASLEASTVTSVLGLLDKYDRKFVCGLSGAVGLLYDWAVGVCEEKLLTDDKAAKRREKQKEKAEEDEENERDSNPYYDEDKKDNKLQRCGHCQIAKRAE